MAAPVWMPDLAGRRGPRYQAIVDALAEDIASNRLAPGMRLPTHRALAAALGVNIGTVTRAYSEARRLGLVVGTLGRGTFLHAPNSPSQRVEPAAGPMHGPIDLSFNQPALGPVDDRLRRVMGSLAESPDLAGLFDYQMAPGRGAHRAAGAAWLARAGMAVGADQVVICNGAQQGLMAALLSVTSSGARIATETINYHGTLRAAALLRLEVTGLECDRDGIRPDSFAALCRHAPPAALVCTPTIQNPTATVMPLDRRRALVEIANRHDVPVIEDDIYGQLAIGAPPPLCSLGAKRWFYVGGTSKSILPGLRVGYIAVPRALTGAVTDAVRSMTWVAAALMAEIATRWIEDGTADEMIAWHRRETTTRQAMARRILGALDYESHAASYHLWLNLPAPWRADAFAREAARRGVLVAPAERFAVDGAPVPAAVRISLGAPQDHAVLEQGLRMLAAVAADAPTTHLAMV